MAPKGFSKYIQMTRANERRKGAAPKGFDITLADAISYLNLNEEQLKQLGTMTKDRQIAHAVVGNQVFYRAEQLKRIFGGTYNAEQATV